MYVCVKCKREMRCDKNGVGVRWRGCHVYAGDIFKCSECGASIVACQSGATHEEQPHPNREYLEMD